jgi:hypothetical protein
MTKEELLDLIVSWENLPLLMQEIENNSEDLDLLMNFAFYSNHPKSWRAAWLADKIHERNPELIAPFTEKMIIRLKTETDDGKKRHFLKLISLNVIPIKHHSFLVNYCLKIFTSAREPVAVRVHALQVLYNISENEPDFKSELLSVIEHEIDLHATPGIISRGKKLVKKS